MSDLEAGRELDALVAEKEIGGNGCAWCEKYPGCICASDHPPHYSTSIAAAWEVVEKKIRDGWTFDVWHRGSWFAVFQQNGELVDAQGDTASHAICLAARKAVGYSMERNHSMTSQVPA